MKADAGYGMASADENSFVNKKSECWLFIGANIWFIKEAGNRTRSKELWCMWIFAPDDKKSLKAATFSAEA